MTDKSPPCRARTVLFAPRKEPFFDTKSKCRANSPQKLLPTSINRAVLRKEVGIASRAEGVGEPPQGAIRHVANDFVYERRVECGGSIRRGRGRDKERRRVVRVVVVPRHVSFAHLRAARRRQRARPESNGIRRGKLALADLGEAGEVEPRVVAGDAMASAIGAAVVHRGRAWLPKVMLARYPYAVPGRAGGDRDVKEAAQRHIALVDGVTRVVACRAGRSPIANHLRGLRVVGGTGIERGGVADNSQLAA